MEDIGAEWLSHRPAIIRPIPPLAHREAIV